MKKPVSRRMEEGRYRYRVEVKTIDGLWIHSVHFPYLLDRKWKATVVASALEEIWGSHYRAAKMAGMGDE